MRDLLLLLGLGTKSKPPMPSIYINVHIYSAVLTTKRRLTETVAALFSVKGTKPKDINISAIKNYGDR